MPHFTIVAFNYVERLLQQAVQDVRRLPLSVLSDPSLAGRLDAIAGNYKPKFEDPSGGTRRPNPPISTLSPAIPSTRAIFLSGFLSQATHDCSK